MPASPDDAAASSVPPRADGGPAAPSFPGTPGRRPPEDSPMSQRPTLSDDRMSDDTVRQEPLSDDTVRHEPLPDETVRMRADGPVPDGGPAARPVVGADDPRPVTRDWLLGAPDTDAGTPPDPVTSSPAPPAPAPVPPGSEDWSTETIDRTPDLAAPAEDEDEDDATTTLDPVPAAY